MGNEFAQGREWDETEALEWHLWEKPYHKGVSTLLSDLNRLYRDLTPLHQIEFDFSGFEWIDCHDSSQSILSYLRKDRDGREVLVVLNFTPVPREGYRIGVNLPGEYREIFNSDSEFYDGSNMGNGKPIAAEPIAWMGRDQSISLILPPLGAILLERV